MKYTAVLLIFCSFWLSSAVVFAQCKVDTECKGERVCVDGQCQLPATPSDQPQPPPPPPGLEPPSAPVYKDIPGYSYSSAVLGYIAAPHALGLIIAADILKAPMPNISSILTIASTALMTTIGPIVAAGGKSVRVSPEITGIPVLKAFGWLFYSLVIGSATPLAIVSALGIRIPDGVVAGTGILALHALGFLATDALVSYYQAKKVLNIAAFERATTPQVQFIPVLGAVPSRDGRSTTPTFGLGGLF